MYKLFLTGSDYHCEMVETLLKQDKEISFTKNIEDADLLYAVYGPGINKETLKYWIFSNKPILIHWIADTLALSLQPM